MIEEAQHDGQSFVDSFAKYYQKDQCVGMTLLISSFVSCYAMMDVKDRYSSLSVMFKVVKEIGTEMFEDGYDFSDFMKQMIPEIKGEE